MARSRFVALLPLSLALAACGNDTTTTTADPSTGAASTGAATTGDSTTAVDPTTGGPTTDGTGGLTGSTGDPTTGTTTTTTTTDTTSDATGEDSTGGSTTGGQCGPGEPGPDADGDTVPDACDQCDGDDLADADGDAVPDACDQCGMGDDALDADGDTVPDACDQCEGDDLADLDDDGLADACDVCPDDPLNDGDGDGICDGVDACPDGPNDIDVDNDGKPDACDEQVLLPLPKPIDDYDVAGDGALVLVRGEAGSLLVTCYNGDRSLRRAEFVAGSYDPGDQLGPHPEIHIARQAQKVLVTWFDRAGGPPNHRIAYSLLDDKCQAVVTSKTAIAVPDAYMEFHDAAIDAAGNSAIAVSPNATYVNFVDAAGVAKGQQQAFDINAVYGTHVALNQAQGGGILAAQQHSGNGIYYRRFKPDGSWVDGAQVMLPVNYHYWYDGFTVGMNDESAFVFLWRSGGTTLDMRFFGADGVKVADVQRATIDFEGWNGGHCYDSFRRRHQEIPLRGDDFVLGEVYNWITMPANRITKHFQYTPTGQLVVEDSTKTNLDEGLTIRVDQVGATYLLGPAGIEIVQGYP